MNESLATDPQGQRTLFSDRLGLYQDEKKRPLKKKRKAKADPISPMMAITEFDPN